MLFTLPKKKMVIKLAESSIKMKFGGIPRNSFLRIIWLEQEGKGNGHFALTQSKIHKNQVLSQAESQEKVGFKKDARDFSRAAEIINELGVKSVRMLTDNLQKVDILTQFGVNVVGIKKIVMD